MYSSAYDSTGALYGWLARTPYNLVSINLTTGLATSIGPAGPSTEGGGLAFSPGGVLYVDNTKNVLRTVNKTTGVTTDGPTINPIQDKMGALAFNSAGTLFGSDDTLYNLVTIDTTTGLVTTIGPLPHSSFTSEHIDALAFTVAATTYLIRYFSNLNVGDSVINLANSGANLVAGAPSSICANVYTFAPDEQEISCCSCEITVNGLQSLSVINDLISNVLTPSVPTSVTVELSATTVPATGCDATTAGTPATGLRAWGTDLHAAPTTPVSYQVTETPFLTSNLTVAQVKANAELCHFIGVLGSGFGICKSCRLGGLGAAAQ